MYLIITSPFFGDATQKKRLKREVRETTKNPNYPNAYTAPTLETEQRSCSKE